jgi:hypothetical protein
MWPPIDPVIGHAVSAAMAIIFILAGISKLRDPAGFRAAVDGYELLPTWATPFVAWMLSLLEPIAGALLLVPETRTSGAELAAFLLLLVFVAGVVSVNRGRTGIDCGCGVGGHAPLGVGLLVRTLALAAAALLLLLPVSARETVWLDLVAALFLAVFLFGLNTLATSLLTQGARLHSLRNLS